MFNFFLAKSESIEVDKFTITSTRQTTRWTTKLNASGNHHQKDDQDHKDDQQDDMGQTRTVQERVGCGFLVQPGIQR